MIGIYHIVVGSFNYVQLDVQLGVADSPLQIMLIFIINPQRFHTHTRNTLTKNIFVARTACDDLLYWS